MKPILLKLFFTHYYTLLILVFIRVIPYAFTFGSKVRKRR